jgi:hypothetical protein
LQIQEVKGDLTIETTEVTSKLTIADSQQDHCGCYTLELRNSYGLRQAALNLTIVGTFHLTHIRQLSTSPLWVRSI